MVKNNIKAQKQVNKNWQQKYFWHIAGLFLILILIAVLWNKFEEIKNKASFEKADKKISSMVEEIKKTVGKPDQLKKEDSCRRASRKFTEGPLSCSIDVFLIYKNKDLDASNNIMKKAVTLNDSPLHADYLLGSKDLTKFTHVEGVDKVQEFYQKLDNINDLSCYMYYFYPNSPNHIDLSLTIENSQNMIINISCQGIAKRQYYPLKT